jgi:hypothetical protein
LKINSNQNFKLRFSLYISACLGVSTIVGDDNRPVFSLFFSLEHSVVGTNVAVENAKHGAGEYIEPSARTAELWTNAGVYW